ncbi:hypothetical protein K2173_022006 [Erythroxylum novogranatense]|uniref:Uncharacterized protein n=1 Tax=Erythroxylum novogranatense TaxID=1862640 RepID=A0AAV8T3Y2_9ROSI|nr:hypothetical protein K2173_022006 [Erythroxylum novogranatense]
MPTSTTMMSLSQKLSLENYNRETLLDVSFSSHLNTAQETLVHKLPESSLKAAVRPGHHNHPEGAEKGREEIGVFTAEKYFKGVMDNGTSPRITNTVTRRHQVQRDELCGAVAIKPQVPAGIPSFRSESSWNSQSALLKSVLRHPSGMKTNKVKGKSILAGLGRKYCSCFDKDSVDGHEHVGEISFKKTPDSGLIHCQLKKLGYELDIETCFSFPTLSSIAGNLPVNIQQAGQLDLFPRKSIEVFGSPVHDRRSKSLSLERRLTMLSWDATPRFEEIAYSAPPRGVHYEKDSDASSDLFEIESHTGRVKPFLQRHGSDATSGCVTPTTCYAPSEASIDWSVATASAADFSVPSDYEDLRSPTNSMQAFTITTNVKTKTCGDSQKRRSSILLGYKNNAAVRVAGDAYRRNKRLTSTANASCFTFLHS